MSKFYVQCGPIQTVIQADSIDQAALAGLDRTLQTHLWIYDDPGLTEQDRHDHMMLEALMHLDPVVRISEQGFNRCDAQWVGTPETIDCWHQLMVGMNRLFIAAGLPPRSMAAVAAKPVETLPSHPRRPR